MGQLGKTQRGSDELLTWVWLQIIHRRQARSTPALIRAWCCNGNKCFPICSYAQLRHSFSPLPQSTLIVALYRRENKTKPRLDSYQAHFKIFSTFADWAFNFNQQDLTYCLILRDFACSQLLELLLSSYILI